MRRKGWYRTAYGNGGVKLVDPDKLVGHFGAELFATSRKHALRVAGQRNLGEHVLSRYPRPRREYELPSELLAKRSPDAAKVMHAAIFLCWIASRSGEVTSDSLLSDKGLLHELAHYFALPREPIISTRRELIERLRQLERAVPGFTAPEE